MNLFPLRAGARIAVAACALLAGMPCAAATPGLQAYVAAERARPVAPSLPRTAFLQRGAIVAIRLSPDGRHVAWLRDRGEQREVWLRATAGGAPRRLLADTPTDALDWSRDGRWLLLRSPRDLQALAVAGQPGSGRIATLGGTTALTMLDTDPSQPAAVLLIEREGPAAAPRAWRLTRVDMRGRRVVLWQDRQRIVDAVIDAHGQLAWLQRVEGSELVIHRVAHGAATPMLRCTPDRRCALRGLAPDGGAWLRTDLQGDLSRLARLQADGRIVDVHVDPQRTADIDEIIEDPVGRQPRFVAYRSTTSQLYALAADDGAHLAALRAALPGRDLDLQPGVGAGARWLVEASSPRAPLRRWHLYDPATHAVVPLLDDTPLDRRSGEPAAALDEALLARPASVAWTASDGRRVHGFLWVPPGRDVARLPLVVVPHGGPWNHWKPEYRALSQLFANRGYAVFEPNFRGSTGHGRGYVLAARGDFGHGRVQADIVEGTRWLLDQGIGDRERVGIVGASFGGYSALLGATFDPALFKVAVATVPPPDFGWVLRWVLRNPEALEIGVVPMESWLLGQGIDVTDKATMARLHAQSPLANVARLRRPVLLMAGGEDRRVGLAGVIEYAARLTLAGKDVTLLVDEQAGHDAGSPVAREARAYLMETMLHRSLGGAAPAPPRADVQAYLRRNLRLPGTSAP